MVFMSAGFDTTATTLGWLMYDLSLHPDVQEKLIAEIDAEIGQVQLVLLVKISHNQNNSISDIVVCMSRMRET